MLFEASARLRSRPARSNGNTPMPTPPPNQRMPLIFLAHGAPPLFDDAAWLAEAGRSDVTFPITGFWNGMSFTRRSVQFA
jgi:hypothetical protein